MTALNRYLTAVAAMLLACLPALGQQPGESAETDLRKAQTLHKAYEFAKAEEYYSKALELTQDSLQKLDIMDKIIQCRNGESLLQYITRPSAVTSGIFSKEDFYLYLQDLDERSWIPIPNPFIKPAGGLRHPYYTAMYLPSGQQTVIFSAPDGTGAWNLYTSTRKDSTTWSVPELLSENILSGRNEIFPLLSRDGRTLYFASDGMPGMGGYDLFRSRWDEEAGEWGIPENLGFPYSSTGDDLIYLDSRDGKYSIVVSNRETEDTDSVKIYVTEYIATPVRTAIREDESPLAIASFIKESAEDTAASPETVEKGDVRMADYSRLMHELRRLQDNLQEKLDKIDESRRIYENASGSDREFLAGIIRDVEEEAMHIRRQMDKVSAQVQQIELRFLSEGIIPVVQEDSPGQEKKEDADMLSAGAVEPEYVFSRRPMGRIPYIIVETPEPEFDYTFKILGRNEGQFVEDNTLPEGVVYQIQFMVLSSPAGTKDIRGMSPVFVTKMKSGKYLHTVGLFSTYQEALNNLSRVRRNGFPDAIVIAYNNGRSIPVKTARTMENERVLSMPASGGSRSGSAPRQTSSAASGEMSYQVVLKGYGPALPSSVLSAIRGATTKDLTKSGSDDATVFAVGPFSERKDAEFLLKILEDLDIKNVSIESIKL